MATDFYPSLSADGQWITFSTRRDNNFEIYVMEVDGGNPRRLTQDLGSNFAPAFSPDGAYIAFTSAQGGFQNVWVMDADGSNARPLTDVGNNGDPEWSPDGRQISFVSDRGGTNELYVMNVADPSQGTDGADARPVAPGLTIGGRNDWSPDGQVLTFYAGEAGARNIFTLNLDGTDLRQLTHVSDNRGPSFSPDGEWIAFASFRDGNNEIYIVRPDGSQLTRLTNNTRPDWQPRWGP
jgi:TolB protein